MKYIKLTAFFLSAVMLLCSCGGNSINEYEKDAQTSNANQNAKMLYQEAVKYTTQAQIAGAAFDALQYSGTLGKSVEELPNIEPDTVLTGTDLETGLGYYKDGPAEGVYTVLLDEDYNPIAVLWAADAETSVVGAYPTMRTVAENASGNIKTADINAAAAK
jgi:hypothetical protein